MQILFTLNRKEALRRGVETANSSVVIDVPVILLSEEEREVLAQSLVDGFKAQSTVFNHVIAIPTPDLAGVKEELAKLVDLRNEAKAEEEKKKEEKESARLAAEAELAKALEQIVGVTEEYLVEGSYGSRVGVKITLPAVPRDLDHWFGKEASREAKASYEAARKAIYAKRDALIQEAKPAAEAAYQAAKEKEESFKSEQAKALAELKSRLPRVLREKDEAGFATGEEIEKEFRRILREDVGFPYSGNRGVDVFETTEGWQASDVATHLTDKEFVKLETLKGMIYEKTRDGLLPERHTLQIKQVWDHGETMVDEDGDEVVPQVSVRKMAILSWTHPSGFCMKHKFRLD